MANPEHLAILKQGVAHWNRWKAQHLELHPDLSGADLSSANLIAAELYRADLGSANLSRADLSGARLNWANLGGANLSRANLTGAYLGEANLGGANLSRAAFNWADLVGANLSRADISGASLSRAELWGLDLNESQAIATTFADVDLSGVKGLESVKHEGPSTVGIDTIYKSRGKIPTKFLRGCGLADWEIETTRLYDPGLSAAEITDIVYRVANIRSNQPFQYYSCFISYSTKDQEFADRLYADLQAKGVRCWFAPHDIKGGQKIYEQIDDAIRLHDRLLLILSGHSMSSEWVNTEIAKARKRELKEGKRVLFPVRLVGFERLRDWECFDADTGKDSAREIREYFIPDFSNWKDHGSHQTAFKRLVGDLKAG